MVGSCKVRGLGPAWCEGGVLRGAKVEWLGYEGGVHGV